MHSPDGRTGWTDRRLPSLSRLLLRAFFPLALVFLLAASVGVATTLGPVTGIKSGYAFVGVALGAAIYYLPIGTRFPTVPEDRLRSNMLEKGLFVVVCLTVSIATLTGERTTPLIIGAVVGYALLGCQLVGQVAPGRIARQAAALFAIGPFTKYLTVGFYYGNADVLGHVGAIQQLLTTHGTAAIDEVYGLYSSFPGLHVLAGSISLLTGLPAYDSLLLAGVFLYTTLIGVFYSIGRAILPTRRHAAFVTVGAAVLSTIAYYSNYFFPQSFASVFVVTILYLAYRTLSLRSSAQSVSVVLWAVIVLALTFTHHFTIVMFTPIFVLLLIPSTVWRSTLSVLPLARLQSSIARPRVIPVLVAVAATTTYWTIGQFGFIQTFYGFVFEKFLPSNEIASDGSSGRDIYAYGLDVNTQTITEAFGSLAAPDGLYYIVLAAVFAVALARVLRAPERYVRVANVLLVGSIASLFVFETPLPDGLNRLALAMAFVFVFVIGIGFYELFALDRQRGGQVLAVVVLVAAGTTGALVAGDDLYGVHAGPDLYEVYTNPEEQVAFGQAEYPQVQAMAEFAGEHTNGVETMWITRESLEAATVNVSEATVTTDGLRSPVPIVYRENWPDHQVGTQARGSLANVVMTEAWFDRAIATESKPYDAGQVGMLWDRTNTTMDGTPSNRTQVSGSTPALDDRSGTNP